MENSIFRKESLDRVNSPEELNSYLRTTKPPVWIALAAVCLLLVGALVWGSLAKLETKARGVVLSQNGACVCYVSQRDVSAVAAGTVVRVEEQTCRVAAVSPDAVDARGVMSDYCMALAGFQTGEYVYALTLDKPMGEGSFPCVIVLDSVSPISFLLSSGN